VVHKVIARIAHRKHEYEESVLQVRWRGRTRMYGCWYYKSQTYEERNTCENVTLREPVTHRLGSLHSWQCTHRQAPFRASTGEMRQSQVSDAWRTRERVRYQCSSPPTQPAAQARDPRFLQTKPNELQSLVPTIQDSLARPYSSVSKPTFVSVQEQPSHGTIPRRNQALISCTF